MFIFPKKKTKIRMKKKKNIFFFILERGLTRFELAPIYPYQGWRIRVT